MAPTYLETPPRQSTFAEVAADCAIQLCHNPPK